jgi:pimeloyl-ACP methyl ester carboxylesterase
MSTKLSLILAGQGQPLVLLHAFPLDQRMWQPQLAGLQDVCRLIVPDLPGFGGSPVSAAREPTVEGMAEVVAGLLDALAVRESIVLGGLSMGGYVALAFARLYPGRLRGLVLADTRTEPDDEAGKANRDRLIAGVAERGTGVVLEAMLPRLLGPATQAGQPEVVARVRQISSEQSAEGITAALRGLRDRPDTGAVLEGLPIPVLVIVGRDDGITPPAGAERMAQRARQGRLVILDGAGHLSNLEDPAGFNNAVRSFLRELG